jgi:O-antigen ligase
VPSLCFLGATVCLLVASLLTGPVYRWVALLLLSAGILARSRFTPNALTIAVCIYGGWLLVNAAMVTPNYTAENLYRPLILVSGFFLVGALERDAMLRLFRIGVGLTALLVLLGFAQVLFGFWHSTANAVRAGAVFAVPNTFATAINLFLLPLLALIAMRCGGKFALACCLWLFAGLVSTESRGGHLGFAAGCGFLLVMVGFPADRQGWARLVSLTALFAVVAVTVVAALVFAHPSGPGKTGGFGETVFSRGGSGRAELAGVALAHVLDQPVLGAGANMFPPLYQMSKPSHWDNDAHYYFVHNDYLQVWLEFGALGLLLLLGLVAAAGYALVRARGDTRHDPWPIAIGAALSSLFAHAAVDFPLFVPYLLLISGAYLGALAQVAGPQPTLQALLHSIKERIGAAGRPVLVAIVAALLAWTSMPAMAALCADRALSHLSAGRMAEGLKWQELARWLERRNPIHYWAEAVMWRELALETQVPNLADKADELHVSGIAANRLEAINYVERSRLHRLHGPLLRRAASASEILQWTAEAVRLRPYSLVTQAEHARALANAGRIEEARHISRGMLERRPEAALVRRLAMEMGLP